MSGQLVGDDGLRRRHAASRRLIPLDCGCPDGPHSDPIDCVTAHLPPLTSRQLDAWRNAIGHLLVTAGTRWYPAQCAGRCGCAAATTASSSNIYTPSPGRPHERSR
jgi:hypothetical protein